MTRHQGMKALLFLIGFFFASSHFAEAQQPHKIHRVGMVLGGSPTSKHSEKGCVSTVMWRVRT